MVNREKRLYMVIGCDTDPDRASIINGVTGGKLSWRGLTEGIPAVKEEVKEITDEIGNPPIFTWLIRADEQIKLMTGDYNRILTEYRHLLSDLKSSGDEIGWHPHFYNYNQRHKIWYQELYNISWQCNMLEKAFNAFQMIFPGKPMSVRTGWTYHNNHTMKKIDELGIKVDFSAVPGLRTRHMKNDKFPYNIFDWYITPKNIYHPASEDYRRPAKSGEEELSIVEAPNFVADSVFWGIVSGLHMTRKMKDPMQLMQSIRKPVLYINLTCATWLFAPIIRTLKRRLSNSNERTIIFGSYFHADEVIENSSSIYSLENLKINLIEISELCLNLNVPIRFIKAEDISDLLKS